MELIKKFMQFALGNVIILLIGFITTPIITHLVSPEELGKYSLFNTVGNLCVLLCMMGIDQAFIRYYYEENETGRVKLSKIFMVFCVLNTLAISVVFFMLKTQIAKSLFGIDSYVPAIVLSVFVLFNILYNIVLLQLRIQQRLNMYNFLHTLQKAGYLIFSIVGSCAGVFGLISAVILSYGIVSLMGFLLERKIWFSKNSKQVKLKHNIRELLIFGFPIFFSSIIAWVFQATDKIMIKAFAGFSELGIYSSAAELIIILNAVQSAFATFWIPVAYEHFIKEPNDTCFFTTVNQIISFLMFVLAIILISSKEILGVLLGDSYQNAAYVFPSLVFMPIMYTISETTVLGINFKKKTIYHIWISIISATSNIILNVLLIPFFGAKGAAMATGLAYFIHWGGRTFFSYKCLKINYGIKKFLVAFMFMYVFAVYASFADKNIIFIAFVVLLLLCLLYRNVIVKALMMRKNYG